ncbi:MAG: hypothetical protein IPJ39_13025 [Saprospiraceae bacterium]|nr:hypothetical protein [Saprospiraceae bacterium]
MKNLSILKIFFGIIFTTLSYFNEISAQTIFEKEAQIRDSLFNLYIDADWCHTSKIPQNQKEPENFNDNRISFLNLIILEAIVEIQHGTTHKVMAVLVKMIV